MMKAILTEGIEPIHYMLAYAGMLLHFLTKLGAVFNLPDFSMKVFMRKNIIPMIISAIGIPILLITITDSSLKETMPINKLTAVFAGWQTQSVFKTLFSLYNKKNLKAGRNTNKNTDSDNASNHDIG